MHIQLSAGFALDVEAEAGETSGRREISGLAAPYQQTATVSGGASVMFAPGSLPVDGKAPKLFMYHDSSQPVGLVTERREAADGSGMLFTAKIAATTAGDEALQLAKEGVLDSVSVGVDVIDSYQMEDGTTVITSADWRELSLVPIPAFASATITDVAAAADTTPDTENDQIPSKEHEVSEVEAAGPEAAPTAPVIFAQPKKAPRLPSAGEWMAAYHIGGDTFAKINTAVIDWRKEHQSSFEAAAGDVLTTDTPGLLPVPVLGPLVQNINFVRPVVNRLGARAYPDGGSQKTFIRPTITTHTSVAAQSPELSAVSATTMVIASNSVSKTTLAGQVTLSAQDIDFTSPAAMQLILNDLMGEYMLASDNLASDNLLAAATSSGVWDGTVTDLMKSIYDAAVDVSNGTNFFPDTIFVSPDVWGQMGQLVDGSNRPVFPYVGAPGLQGFNALGGGNASTWVGSNPLGLEIVVDSNFAAKTMVITNSQKAFEFYEQVRGLMSVEVPSTLGRTFSFYGYVSTFAAVSSMIRKITQA
jgi:HK97 family phage prohead protease